MILDKIVEAKRNSLIEDKRKMNIEAFKRGIKLSKGPGLYYALKKNKGIGIIAEIKKASPSKGIIRKDFKPAEIAREYCRSEADAISVLTEKDFFQGSQEHLCKVRQVSTLPVLRKDFIIDLWQIYESAFLGADAVLLITSILTDEELKKFQTVAEILGMNCLVEAHDIEETKRAVKSGAKIIGINNRDLGTFEVDISTTEKLLNYIPNDRVVVSESGINTYEDMSFLERLGVDGVLIGESLMRAESISKKLDELREKNKNSLLCKGWNTNGKSQNLRYNKN